MNPIVVKSARSRMRWKYSVSWGLVVVTLTGFITVVNYMIATHQNLAAPAEAARLTLLPTIIIQAVILMLLGTGAVASGISQERDEGLLDYQRMTPMSPSAKLIGYLFGLPIREYFLFSLTLPFAAFGIIRGEFPITTALHFYAIFFSSVLVYHMTGMAAGMASTKPRRAGLIAQGMVLFLYFVLPNLSHLGLTFFEFLTIRPALFGLIYNEVQRLGGDFGTTVVSQLTALDSFRSIPFFGVHLHPSVYTGMVQGSLLVTLWVVVHRKWRDEAAHPFSKVFGLVFFAGASTFLLGSVWPILKNGEVMAQFVSHFLHDRALTVEEALFMEELPLITTLLIFVSALVLAGTAILTLLCTTPSRHKMIEGWRRAVRLGHRRVPPTWDASSSLPLGAICAAITGGAIWWCVSVAATQGLFPARPETVILLTPIVYVAAALLFLQAVLERFGKRAFFVSIFLLWMVPFFIGVLLIGAFEREVAAAYVWQACPPGGLFFMAMQIVETTASEPGLSDLPSALVSNLPQITLTGMLGYVALASAGALANFRQHRRIRLEALGEERERSARAADRSAASALPAVSPV